MLIPYSSSSRRQSYGSPTARELLCEHPGKRSRVRIDQAASSVITPDAIRFAEPGVITTFVEVRLLADRQNEQRDAPADENQDRQCHRRIPDTHSNCCPVHVLNLSCIAIWGSDHICLVSSHLIDPYFRNPARPTIDMQVNACIL